MDKTTAVCPIKRDIQLVEAQTSQNINFGSKQFGDVLFVGLLHRKIFYLAELLTIIEFCMIFSKLQHKGSNWVSY